MYYIVYPKLGSTIGEFSYLHVKKNGFGWPDAYERNFSYLKKLGYAPERCPRVEAQLLKVDRKLKDVYSENIGPERGWIVSSNVMNILQDFYLAPHIAYQMRFVSNGAVNSDYYYLFFYTEYYQ